LAPVPVVLASPPMNKRPLFLTCTAVGSFLVGFGLLGCASGTSLDAKSAHDTGKGTLRVYAATYDQAWAAAHAAISWNGVGAPTDHTDLHYVITDPTRFDQIGIWLEPEGTDKAHVTVVVIDDPNLPGPNEESVQKDVASALDLIKAGKPTDKRPN
jgi:hypothetical protein